MRQGTTPPHTYVLPMSTDMLQEIEIVYVQEGRTVVRRLKQDMACEGNKVTLQLTQNDTFSFSAESNVEIQVRVKTNEGAVFGSGSMYVTVEKCLSTEVL